jgi:hypothetical protein
MPAAPKDPHGESRDSENSANAHQREIARRTGRSLQLASAERAARASATPQQHRARPPRGLPSAAGDPGEFRLRCPGEGASL